MPNQRRKKESQLFIFYTWAASHNDEWGVCVILKLQKYIKIQWFINKMLFGKNKLLYFMIKNI